jgi:imidazolonepropionase-like amidohydrolase
MDKEVGTVEAGKRADLVVIRGHPLEDIRNSRNVEYVVTNGTMYNAGELWKSVGFKP